MMSRAEDRQILFRETKQANRRRQTSAVFGMRGMLKALLQMNERTCGLDQSLVKIVVFRVPVQPKLLENIMCFVITLFVPAFEIGAVIWMIDDVDLRRIDSFASELAHEARNPLAFVHEELNLIAAPMMGKLAGFTFPGQSGNFLGRGEK